METKLVKDRGAAILEKCGFWHSWEVPHKGMSGGLLLGWMKDMTLNILCSSKHILHADLVDKKGTPLSISFVYGHPNLAKREEVWTKLRNLKNLAHKHWVCIGDFNQILSQEDKFSFSHRKIEGAEAFNQTLFELGLCELKATRQNFTWMNGHGDETFVMERLDRAFATVDWINSNLLYAFRNLPIIRSDHGPIILDSEFQHPFRKRPFRFEKMWSAHEGCKALIQNSWSLNSQGSKAFQFQQKLKHVKNELSSWNRNVFGKVDIQIREKQKILQ